MRLTPQLQGAPYPDAGESRNSANLGVGPKVPSRMPAGDPNAAQPPCICLLASSTSSKVRKPVHGALTSTAMLPGRCSFFHMRM